MAAQLSRPLPSGQRSLSPKDPFVSASFTLPQRETSDGEEGRDDGKSTDHENSSWLLTDMLAPVSHSLILSHVVSLVEQPFPIAAQQSEHGPPTLCGPKEPGVAAEFSGRSQPSSLRKSEESDSLLQHIQVWTHHLRTHPLCCLAVKTSVLIRT